MQTATSISVADFRFSDSRSAKSSNLVKHALFPVWTTRCVAMLSIAIQPVRHVAMEAPESTATRLPSVAMAAIAILRDRPVATEAVEYIVTLLRSVAMVTFAILLVQRAVVMAMESTVPPAPLVVVQDVVEASLSYPVSSYPTRWATYTSTYDPKFSDYQFPSNVSYHHSQSRYSHQPKYLEFRHGGKRDNAESDHGYEYTHNYSVAYFERISERRHRRDRRRVSRFTHDYCIGFCSSI